MKGLKFFLIGLVASLPLWLGVNGSEAALENVFLDSLFYPPTGVLLAQASGAGLLQKKDFDVEAKSALVLKISPDGSQTVVFEKNSKRQLPIASLTKLMTAVVSLENQPLGRQVEITSSVVSQEGATGHLREGEMIEVGELLKMALIESSNDAAEALAEIYGRDPFVQLMNFKAKELSLRSTGFSTPTGLEAENNFSTSRDLTTLSAFILRNHPLIFEISSRPSITIKSNNGRPHHRAFNTNELLNSFGEIEGLKIVGGKTGYTDEAGGCIILILQDQSGNYFISVILGARDAATRFVEMRKIIEEIKSGF